MLQDVQATPDTRGVSVDEVGIDFLRYPVTVATGQGAKRETVATVSMSVSLGPDVKGAHLSRFIEILHATGGQLSSAGAAAMAGDVRHCMGSDSATVRFSFPYFLEREAPATRARAYVEYTCAVTARSDSEGTVVSLGVDVPVTSVCPCSKAISDRGAHNQRGHISIELTLSDMSNDLWFDELIDDAERSASSPVYTLLKRPDERHVTMAAYDNPVFVEDMVRNVCLILRERDGIASYRVRAVNDESIHNHGAFAEVAWTRVGGRM